MRDPNMRVLSSFAMFSVLFPPTRGSLDLQFGLGLPKLINWCLTTQTLPSYIQNNVNASSLHHSIALCAQFRHEKTRIKFIPPKKHDANVDQVSSSHMTQGGEKYILITYLRSIVAHWSMSIYIFFKLMMKIRELEVNNRLGRPGKKVKILKF